VGERSHAKPSARAALEAATPQRLASSRQLEGTDGQGRCIASRVPAIVPTGRSTIARVPVTAPSGRCLIPHVPVTAPSGRWIIPRVPVTAPRGRRIIARVPVTAPSGRRIIARVPAIAPLRRCLIPSCTGHRPTGEKDHCACTGHRPTGEKDHCACTGHHPIEEVPHSVVYRPSPHWGDASLRVTGPPNRRTDPSVRVSDADRRRARSAHRGGRARVARTGGLLAKGTDTPRCTRARTGRVRPSVVRACAPASRTRPAPANAEPRRLVLRGCSFAYPYRRISTAWAAATATPSSTRRPDCTRARSIAATVVTVSLASTAPM
jgi:hypothetical protein